MTKDNEIPGLDSARGWYASIVEMIEELERAQNLPPEEWDNGPGREGPIDEATQTIHESVLSVEVRSDWYIPGATREGWDSPAEYRILLTTGGPALQIVGTLSAHGEPETAELQSHDWVKPWTTIKLMDLLGPERFPRECDGARETLLTFARCFYFGE